MKRVLLGAAVVVAMMAFAAPAFAQTGSVEICKHSTTLSGTRSFTFHVSNGGGMVWSSLTTPVADPSLSLLGM